MNFSDTELPSNSKFGFFFSVVFLVAFLYFFISGIYLAAYTFASLTLLFFIITLVKAELLLPFNKLWMRFGVILSLIISPLILGIIFFGLITPIALLMRLFGRDELRLRLANKSSYWIDRNLSTEAESFKYQF